MYFIWVTRGLYSSLNTMFTFVYQVELYRKQSPAGYLLVCLHTHCKCFEETAQITIMSGLSYFPVFSKRSWIAIGPRLQKPVLGDL